MQQQSDDTPPEDTIGPTAEGKEPLIVFEDDEFIRKWWDAVNDDDDDDDDVDDDDDDDAFFRSQLTKHSSWCLTAPFPLSVSASYLPFRSGPLLIGPFVPAILALVVIFSGIMVMMIRVMMMLMYSHVLKVISILLCNKHHRSVISFRPIHWWCTMIS